MAYISSSDITDSQARAFVTANDSRLSTWLARVEDEIESIAQERNVLASDIVEPVHYKIKEYALCYFSFLVFQDVFTTNNVETPEIEKYRLKLDWYKDRCNQLRPTLTKEMFQIESASLSANNRIGAGMLWRG
jgi:hypothetical protein